MAAAILAAAALLYFHNPEENSYAPKCLLYSTTGIKCPGCGGQRAVYHLLHGHLVEAIRYNFFLCLFFPYLSLVCAAVYSETEALKKTYSRKALFLYMALYFLWWLVRNLFGW